MPLTILLATQNPGKLIEVEEILTGLPIKLLRADKDLAVDETADTFVGNAQLKAEAYAKAYNLPALSDDSGLIVDALDGRPGVHSKRYGSSDSERNEKLLQELQGITNRTARFVSVIYLAGLETPLVAEGTVEGHISTSIQGTKGFGFDPVFIPDGYEQTFAELGATVKNGISHRARALALLRKDLEMYLTAHPLQ
jgi:XTP/dITP diphosphohydrolase